MLLESEVNFNPLARPALENILNYLLASLYISIVKSPVDLNYPGDTTLLSYISPTRFNINASVDLQPSMKTSLQSQVDMSVLVT
jgi:hypothetical protein